MDKTNGSTLNSMLWNGFQRFGGMGMSFITNLILARLLSPHEFGIVGLILIFITISETFVDGGLGSALIQKVNATEKDYNTIFNANIFISIAIYLVIYFSASSVSRYFNLIELEKVLKIQAIVILINAIGLVQTSKLVKSLNFKKLAKINLAAVVISNIVVVILAFKGFSFWSIVIKNIVFSMLNVSLLWWYSKWRPKWEFDYKSFKSLFEYGSFILLTNLIEKIYTNFQSFVIGKNFNSIQLGFYSQAYKLQDLPANSISGVINQVTFPIYSSVQNDKDKLLQIFKNNLQIVSYFNFLLFIVLFFIAEPLILLLFGNQWNESIYMFKILCVTGLFYPINTIYSNVTKGIGKSRMYFFQQTSKRIIGICIILISIQFGIKGVIYSSIVVGLVSLIINIIIVRKVLNYNIVTQIKNLSNNFIVLFLTAFIAYLFNEVLMNLLMIYYILSYLVIIVSSYIFFSVLLRNDSYSKICLFVKEKYYGKS